jgi:Ser/Thr protein kinase RdoA (MazF antagonist)
MDELTAYLLDAFGLGPGPARLTSVARGAEGQVSLLECAGARYAVKQPFAAGAGSRAVESGEEVLRREAVHLAHFARAGLAVPAPLADVEGRFLVPVPRRLGGGFVRLSRWVEGARPGTGFVPGRHAAELGGLLGRLHGAAPPTQDPIGPWYRTAPDPQAWTDLLTRGAGTAWHAAMVARHADLDRLGDVVREPGAASGPVVVGHRDLHPDNVLVTPDGQLVPVDWEDVGPMVPDRELAKALVQWHVQAVEVDKAAVRQTLAGYRMAGGTGELRGLDSFTMVLSGELNFLAVQAARTLDPTLDAIQARHAAGEAQDCLAWLPTVPALRRVLAVAR